MDRTNTYRLSERQQAYERSLRKAEKMDEDCLYSGAAHLGIALDLDESIPRDVRKQIAAKAVRVTRHRRG